MVPVRQPAVAGRFYPDDPTTLSAMVENFLDAAAARGLASVPASAEPSPKALIAPHAGYAYSGAVAAAAYACLRRSDMGIRRVVMLGPAHRLAVRGTAVSRAAGFATPLGAVPVDQKATEDVVELPHVDAVEEAHRLEHCLEVQLPFLQVLLGSFTLVPLLIGAASMEEVVELLDTVWGAGETLIVVSSDLSHYHDYATACRIDRSTSRSIAALREQDLQPEMACGCTAIRALVSVARRLGLSAREVDLCNSGDTAGPKDKVVGYGSYAFA